MVLDTTIELNWIKIDAVLFSVLTYCYTIVPCIEFTLDHCQNQSETVLTQVQDHFQVVSGGQRLRALHSDGEGLTPAHNQALRVNLLGAVSQVVFITSQIHISDQT